MCKKIWDVDWIGSRYVPVPDSYERKFYCFTVHFNSQKLFYTNQRTSFIQRLSVRKINIQKTS